MNNEDIKVIEVNDNEDIDVIEVDDTESINNIALNNLLKGEPGPSNSLSIGLLQKVKFLVLL